MQKTTEILQGSYYHIYNRSINKELLFKEERNYYYFMHLYEKYIYPLADLFAYCLLPNHFLFFIKTKIFHKEDTSINFSRAFSNLFNAYTKAINKNFNRDGSLFKERFRRKEITNDNYYTNLVFYIHTNPVHHGLCADYRTYKYSSYQNYINSTYDKLSKNEMLDWFGGREKFIKYHDEKIKGDTGKSSFLENEKDE